MLRGRSATATWRSRTLPTVATALARVVRPDEGSVRLARAAALGGSSVLLATGAHLAGGGGSPNVAVLILAACVSGLVALAVTARRCRLPLLLVILGLEQSGLHLLFGYTTGAGGCVPPGSTLVGHGGHPGASCLSLAVHPATAEPGLAMMLAHVAAVLVTAYLLARGEQWLWSLVTTASAYAAWRQARRRTRPVRTVTGLVVRAHRRPLIELAPSRGPPQA